jgi:anti-sigma factor RsiW
LNDATLPTCREVIEFLADYLDGSLRSEARAGFDLHLARCPSCVAYLESYKQTVQMGREALRADDQPAAGRVPEGLLKAIRAARTNT